MDTSEIFSYVPIIGHNNVIKVTDEDTGNDQKFVVALDALSSPANGAWVPSSANGDEGNLDLGGLVDSYTTKNPDGRRGNMITYMQLLSEDSDVKIVPPPNFLSLIAIPQGMAPGATSPLLDKKYSLSNQPPAESFDYSKFLPRVDVYGCLSLYGGAIPGASGSYNEPLGPTGRFPSVPTLPPFGSDGTFGGVLFYLPPGFYGNINTILNDLFGVPDQFNITLVDQPQYGILAVAAQYEEPVDGAGSGCLVVDFSHTGTN